MSDSIRLVLILLAIIGFCYLVYIYIKYNLKHKIETITSFTGGLGAGKTLLCVESALRKYKQVLKKWKYKNFVLKLTKKPLLEKPLFFSNIPVLIDKKKKIYSCELTNDILLLQKRIPEYSICLIDEIGSYASQFDFKEEALKKSFDEFCRFFRHYVGGYMFVNDQCSENIVLYVRRRMNTIHNLSNCFVFGPFCWYFDRQINISEEIKTIDTKQDSEQSSTQDNKELKFKILHYRKSYDTRCYSERYKRVPKLDVISQHQKLKTLKLLKCDFNNANYKIPLTSCDYILVKKGD